MFSSRRSVSSTAGMSASARRSSGPSGRTSSEKKLQLARGAKTCRSKRVESGHPTHQRRLVVGSRSAVETPFRFHAPAGRERVPRDLAASFLERLVAKNRSPRIACPLFRVDRLTVVVRGQNHGALCSGRSELSQYD